MVIFWLKGVMTRVNDLLYPIVFVTCMPRASVFERVLRIHNSPRQPLMWKKPRINIPHFKRGFIFCISRVFFQVETLDRKFPFHSSGRRTGPA